MNGEQLKASEILIQTVTTSRTAVGVFFRRILYEKTRYGRKNHHQLKLGESLIVISLPLPYCFSFLAQSVKPKRGLKNGQFSGNRLENFDLWPVSGIPAHIFETSTARSFRNLGTVWFSFLFRGANDVW